MAAALVVAASLRAEPVLMPQLEGPAPIKGHWFALSGEAKRPAVLALHGCGGLYQKDGKTLDARYPAYVKELHALGVHVLLADSWGSRGLGPQCSVRYSERSIGVADRRADVLAALAWLRAQPQVDPARIALLGWSNGATTGLAVLDPERTHAIGPLAGAALYYPGCGRVQRQAKPASPVLMQLGGADDWTPAAPCEAVAQRWAEAGADVQHISYPGAFHGFDSDRPVRFRSDVPNGVNAKGVHQGGQPEAQAASLKALRGFLTRVLALKPAEVAP